MSCAEEGSQPAAGATRGGHSTLPGGHSQLRLEDTPSSSHIPFLLPTHHGTPGVVNERFSSFGDLRGKNGTASASCCCPCCCLRAEMARQDPSEREKTHVLPDDLHHPQTSSPFLTLGPNEAVLSTRHSLVAQAHIDYTVTRDLAIQRARLAGRLGCPDVPVIALLPPTTINPCAPPAVALPADSPEIKELCREKKPRTCLNASSCCACCRKCICGNCDFSNYRYNAPPYFASREPVASPNCLPAGCACSLSHQHSTVIPGIVAATSTGSLLEPWIFHPTGNASAMQFSSPSKLPSALSEMHSSSASNVPIDSRISLSGTIELPSPIGFETSSRVHQNADQRVFQQQQQPQAEKSQDHEQNNDSATNINFKSKNQQATHFSNSSGHANENINQNAQINTYEAYMVILKNSSSSQSRNSSLQLAHSSLPCFKNLSALSNSANQQQQTRTPFSLLQNSSSANSSAILTDQNEALSGQSVMQDFQEKTLSDGSETPKNQVFEPSNHSDIESEDSEFEEILSNEGNKLSKSWKKYTRSFCNHSQTTENAHRSCARKCSHGNNEFPAARVAQYVMSAFPNNMVTGARKVPRKNLVRLIMEALRSLNYTKSLATLEQESGYRLESPLGRKLRVHVREGNWDHVIKIIEKIDMPVEDFTSVASAVREQQIVELLDKNETLAALGVFRENLNTVISEGTARRVSRLFHDKEQNLLRRKITGYSNLPVAVRRAGILYYIQEKLPARHCVPEHRLEKILSDSIALQETNCIFHAHCRDTYQKTTALLRDHQCEAIGIGLKCLSAITTSCRAAVTDISFSPCGWYIAATLSAHRIVIVNMKNHRSQEIYVPGSGIPQVISWSPNGEYLAAGTCFGVLVIVNLKVEVSRVYRPEHVSEKPFSAKNFLEQSHSTMRQVHEHSCPLFKHRKHFHRHHAHGRGSLHSSPSDQRFPIAQPEVQSGSADANEEEEEEEEAASDQEEERAVEEVGEEIENENNNDEAEAEAEVDAETETEVENEGATGEIENTTENANEEQINAGNNEESGSEEHAQEDVEDEDPQEEQESVEEDDVDEKDEDGNIDDNDDNEGENDSAEEQEEEKEEESENRHLAASEQREEEEEGVATNTNETQEGQSQEQNRPFEDLITNQETRNYSIPVTPENAHKVRSADAKKSRRKSLQHTKKKFHSWCDEDQRQWSRSWVSVAAHRLGIKACRWLPDGKRLVTGSSDGQLILWEASGRAIIRYIGMRIQDFAITPDGSRIVAIGNDRSMRVFDLATFSVIHDLNTTGWPEVTALAMCPSGRRLFLNTISNGLLVQDLSMLEPVKTLVMDLAYAKAAAKAAENAAIAASDRAKLKKEHFSQTRESELRGTTRLQRQHYLRMGSDKKEVQRTIMSKLVLRPAAGNNYAATGFSGGHVAVWHVPSQNHVVMQLAHRGPVNSIKWNPVDDCVFASCSDDGTIKLWSIASVTGV